MTDHRREDQFSDELLNAFVDDELSVEDKERIYRHLEADTELRRRVDELRRLKDLTRTAFQSVEPGRRRGSPGVARRRWGMQLAAGLAVLAVGAAIGYGIATRTLGPGEAALAHNLKVLFNVSRNDPGAFSKALDQAEILLKNASLHEPVRVRVVVHLDGLRLLTVETAFAPRIQRMLERYAGRLVFMGCTATKRQWAGAGDRSELLPQLVMVESGIHEVVRGEQQGWTNIHI